jgi:flagellar biosynthesis/type III secretory pathway protein FliH
MMSRLLQAPSLDAPARRLAPPEPVLDAATTELLARVEAQAYQRGHQDGVRAADAAASGAADRIAQSLREAVADVQGLLHEDHLARSQRLVNLARELAEAVIGHELHAGGQALLERVRAALSVVDHGPFVVDVHHDDVAVLEQGLPDGQFTVRAGVGLQPGEARISGPWSDADLTHRAVLASLTAEVGA